MKLNNIKFEVSDFIELKCWYFVILWCNDPHLFRLNLKIRFNQRFFVWILFLLFYPLMGDMGFVKMILIMDQLELKWMVYGLIALILNRWKVLSFFLQIIHHCHRMGYGHLNDHESFIIILQQLWIALLMYRNQVIIKFLAGLLNMFNFWINLSLNQFNYQLLMWFIMPSYEFIHHLLFILNAFRSIHKKNSW